MPLTVYSNIGTRRGVARIDPATNEKRVFVWSDVYFASRMPQVRLCAVLELRVSRDARAKLINTFKNGNYLHSHNL